MCLVSSLLSKYQSSGFEISSSKFVVYYSWFAVLYLWECCQLWAIIDILSIVTIIFSTSGFASQTNGFALCSSGFALVVFQSVLAGLHPETVGLHSETIGFCFWCCYTIQTFFSLAYLVLASLHPCPREFASSCPLWLVRSSYVVRFSRHWFIILHFPSS